MSEMPGLGLLTALSADATPETISAVAVALIRDHGAAAADAVLEWQHADVTGDVDVDARALVMLKVLTAIWEIEGGEAH